MTTLYWNKGNSHMHRKIADISTLISQHKPHIFGLAEANVLSSHNQDDLKIPNYNLHLPSSIANPALGSMARVAVYSHKSITVKRRPDLEDPLLQLICLETGLPGKSKSLYMVGYRQWQLAGQPDRSSSTVPAQAERWDRLLTLWEAALGEGREVIMVMDANLDAMTWRKEPHTLPRNSTSLTHSALIDAFYDRILSVGVEMMTPTIPTWARGHQRSCLDHVYTTAPSKLSAVSVLWTGMSEHALVKFDRLSKSIQCRQTYIRKRMFKNFKPDEFKQRVSNMPELQSVLLSSDVDTAAVLLTQGLTRILDNMAPVRTIQTRKDYAPHMADRTNKLQVKRNTAQERAVRSGSQEDWGDYRSLRNQTTASLRRDLVAYRKGMLCSKENSPADLWKNVNRILN